MPNHLIHETSPYLLQHAHNPVDWHAWNEETLQKALTADKPILVSIGYASCHWCHVMEKESFEDAETAAIMNANFINIKIDREERPDIDQVYMAAVQAMTGSGGWPLHVFLTPDKKPFYGGTYFPPVRMMNRPSWKEVLLSIADAFFRKRQEIYEQAENLSAHLQQSNTFGLNVSNDDHSFQTEMVHAACANLLRQADTKWGGFGAAPKFPQTNSIQFLLRYYYSTKQEQGETHAGGALQQALLSIDKMIEGGIHDQLGGGFSRYATDKEWLVPHFEKMLYDNALLVSVISEAYQLTKNAKYKEAIATTLNFIESELQHAQKGFYTALDADSEGEEGKFYVWTAEEIKNVLQEDAHLFMAYYGVTETGNWEGKNILHRAKTINEVADAYNKPATAIKNIIDVSNEKLLAARAIRTRPALDDKIILSWNALMNIAYSKAYAATGNEHYKLTAIANMQFLLDHFKTDTGQFHHVWKMNTAKFPAFLDDYAYLIQALLQLQRITADTTWLDEAKRICELVISGFSAESGYFYYTPADQTDVIVRKTELYDGATPSGNAIMAHNLYELGILFDQKQWMERAALMVNGIREMVIKYPTSFGAWLCVFLQIIQGSYEIVITGNYKEVLQELLSNYLPHAIVMSTSIPNDAYPLLQGKVVEENATLFLCRNYSCQQPVYSVKDLIEQMNQS